MSIQLLTLILSTLILTSIMPKGGAKRKQAGGQFQKNHTYHPGRWKAEEDDPVPGPSSVPDCQPHQSDEEDYSPVLRPQSNLQKTEENERLGHRIVNLDSVISMINSLLRDHQNLSAACKTANFKLDCERKVGLGSDLRFVCTDCKLTSKAYRTYEPAVGKNRGAVINKLLASALLKTSLGAEQGNILLCSMDLPNIARSHLQNLIDEAADSIQETANKDMAEKRQLVIQHNRDKGVADPYQVDVSFDCRYNGKLKSSYKPGTGASQAYGVCTENHTMKSYVIALTTENKLCWTGAYLRNKGYDVQCPNGHAACTANIEFFEPHSERRMAHDIASQLYEENIFVRTVTTDGDTKSFLGMQDFYDKLDEAWEVTRQADQNHLGNSQERRARRANWSRNMFPNKKGSARQEAVSAFARDIKARCHKIIKKLRTIGDGDITKKLRDLPRVCRATVECYSGNCHFCPHDTYVCLGVGGVGDWWYHSTFLPTHEIDHLEMTENDKELLHKILEIRLSERAVASVASNTSTQKCEAFSRAVLANLPKATNHPRNFSARVAAKAVQTNNSLKYAVDSQVQKIMGHKLSPRPAKYIQTRSQHAEKKKDKQKTPEAKADRIKKIATRQSRYHLRRRSGSEYVQGQNVSEHLYAKGLIDFPE